MKKKLTILILIFVFLFAGCQSGTQIEAPSASQNDQSKGYPEPEAQLHESTSYPVTEEPVRLDTATPAPGTGKVVGTLQLNGKPVKDTLLFLGTFLKNTEGIEFTAVVEPSVSPKAYTDDSGVFVFTNIPPGKYTLVIDNVLNQFLLFVPGTQENFSFEVTPEGTVDLGILNYDDLPIPSP